MDTRVYTPNGLFDHNVVYEIPLFQRPYVWNEKDQWEPLWNDVLRLCELLEENDGETEHVTPHFMGAVVVAQEKGKRKPPIGHPETRSVIDGQQRLTTLQLLLDAAQETIENLGVVAEAEGLERLVLNPNRSQGRENFKIRPTRKDQTVFRQVMTNGGKVEDAGAKIARAHAFFSNRIAEYLHDGVNPEDGNPNSGEASVHMAKNGEILVKEDVDAEIPDTVLRRIEHLSTAICHMLNVVVIDLGDEDDPHVIFETLNHRGAPLFVADLVKNDIFHQLRNKGLSEEELTALYDKYWAPLEDDWWRSTKHVGMGKELLDKYTYHWLNALLGKYVRQNNLYSEYRAYVVQNQKVWDPEVFLQQFHADALIYRAAATGSTGDIPHYLLRFWNNVIGGLREGVATPFFLWAVRAERENEGEENLKQVQKALGCAESWLFRRRVCGMKNSIWNKLQGFIFTHFQNAETPAPYGDIVERYLASKSAPETLWPTDDMVREKILSYPAYNEKRSANARVLLEIVENFYRPKYSEYGPCPPNLTVEHIMPQKWRNNWNNPPLSKEEGEKRDALVHTLGNLTLVLHELNSSLSNQAWKTENDGGKWSILKKHSKIDLNGNLVEKYPQVWNETTIKERTGELGKILLKHWYRPDIPIPLTEKQKASPHLVSKLDAKAVKSLSKTLENEMVDMGWEAKEHKWGISLTKEQHKRCLMHVRKNGHVRVETNFIGGEEDSEQIITPDIAIKEGFSAENVIAVDYDTVVRVWRNEAVSKVSNLLTERTKIPDGHTDSSHSGLSVPAKANIRNLIDAGIVRPGMKITPTPRAYAHLEAEITEEGNILFNGITYSSPSSAGGAAINEIAPDVSHPNGWDFWADNHGRKLSVYRSNYANQYPDVSNAK